MGPAAPSCGYHTAAHHGTQYVYSGNSAAVVGALICVVLLLWWLHAKTHDPEE